MSTIKSFIHELSAKKKTFSTIATRSHLRVAQDDTHTSYIFQQSYVSPICWLVAKRLATSIAIRVASRCLLSSVLSHLTGWLAAGADMRSSYQQMCGVHGICCYAVGRENARIWNSYVCLMNVQFKPSANQRRWHNRVQSLSRRMLLILWCGCIAYISKYVLLAYLEVIDNDSPGGRNIWQHNVDYACMW